MAAPIEDVPAKDVGRVVQNFIDREKVKHFEVEEQDDGTFTITPLD